MLTAARIGIRDLARARRFYDPIATLVGATLVYDRPDLIGYKGSDGAMLLIGLPLAGEATAGNGAQVAIAAASRGVVETVHARALKLGGTDEEPPGIRGDDPDGFYGAYFRDPDGNKLAVFRFGPP